jgi:hypothetical protein
MPYKDKEQQKEYQRRWMAKRRSDAIAARGGKCCACDSTDRLEFHHVEKSEKIDHRIWSWSSERREKELAKCDLLCDKCHWDETATERGYYNYTHGTLTYYKVGCRCDDCKTANAQYEHNRRLSLKKDITHVEG